MPLDKVAAGHLPCLRGSGRIYTAVMAPADLGP
jgi:hypothetical protein